MPIYEFKCKKCGEISAYFEKMDQWRLLPRKCKQCGSRKTHKVLSRFSSSVERTYTETLNELKQMGNVQFVPKQTNPWGDGPPPGGCPYENAAKEEEKKQQARPVREPPIEVG